MEVFLLSVHVVAAILFVGPVAVTASLFPRYAPVLVPAGRPVDGDEADVRSAATAGALHRVTRGYGTVSVVVPVVGFVLAAVQGRTGEVWIVLAMVLTVGAGVLLAAQIVPRQREALTAPDDGARLRRLGMLAGVFNLLWVVVVVLMVVRPGSAHP
jgi:hypothetical protein